MNSSSDPDRILAKAMMYLIQTAANDGIITEEEVEMIDSFEISLQQYKRALHEALEDGRITKEEEEHLLHVKDIIIQSGRIVADMVDGISKDEMNLLVSMMLSLDVPKEDREDQLFPK